MDIQPFFETDGTSIDPLRPSIFELLADEQLRELFNPLVRYVLSYLAQRYPRYLLRLLDRHEEATAFILVLIERHHLRKHNASLSEHFYRLRLAPKPSIPTPRLDALRTANAPNLGRRQRWGMIVFLVGLPYLRAKAQAYFVALGGGTEGEVELDIRDLTISQRLYKTVYPYFNLSFDLALSGYDLAYLFEKTSDFRPWHKLLGVKLRRKTQDDEPSSSSTVLSLLPPLLPPLLLLLKLSQWWYSSSSPRSVNLATPNFSFMHPHVPPPRPLPILPSSDIVTEISEIRSEESGVPVDRDETRNSSAESDLNPDVNSPQHYRISSKNFGKCPLCRRKWQNPAILPSGWVVCWRCGWDAIELSEEVIENSDQQVEDVANAQANGHGARVIERRLGRCPITGVAVRKEELRRVLV